MKKYKVLMIKEGALGTLFFGSSGLPIKKLETVLNEEAKDGWEVVFQIIENKRMLLFWKREAIIITLAKGG